MGIKRYIIVTLIYMLAIGLYVYSFNGESYTLELFGLSLTLPIAFWMVVPVLLLAIASIGHLVFYNFKDFLYKRALKKDIELFQEAAKSRILGEEVTTAYKTDGFKFAGKVLQSMHFDATLPTSFIEEDVANACAVAVSVANGNYEDLKKYKLAKTNPLVIQNSINRLKIEPRFALEVLKNCKELDSELCLKAYDTLLDFASFNEIKRYDFPQDKRTFRRMMERYLDADDSFDMDIKSIEDILEQFNADRADYLELAREIKIKLSPDALIALFEKLYNSKGNVAADAYLYVLYDLQMIDKIRELLLNSDPEDFVKFKTIMFLRDHGKSIDIDKFFAFMIHEIDFERGILALAPLAGFTDLPFRSVVKKFGADVTFSEMISANALRYRSEKTFKMLTKSPLETPYIVQIAGSDLDSIKEAVLVLNDIEGIDGIDLNCGCPVPKIISQEAGSSLLLNLPHMQKIIETIKKYSNKRYTSAKVRLGFTTKIPEEIAKACESAGVDFMSMHGRTRAGAYKAEVDYQAIARAREVVKIPLIANGDITSYEKALHVKEVTGCNSLMIGRGAVGNPWIFYQIQNELMHVEKTKILEIVLEHFDAMVDFYGEKGHSIFRKHLHTYSKGFREASEFRDKINRIEDDALMRETIEAFFVQ